MKGGPILGTKIFSYDPGKYLITLKELVDELTLHF